MWGGGVDGAKKAARLKFAAQLLNRRAVGVLFENALDLASQLVLVPIHERVDGLEEVAVRLRNHLL